MDQPAPRIAPEDFAARRDRVAERLEDDQVLVVATHAEALHSGDVHHRFRPHSDFWYLTGFGEPGAVLTLDASGTSHVFVQERDPAQEIWNGHRMGVAGALDALDVDQAHAIGDLAGTLPDIVASRSVLSIARHDAATDERLRNVLGDTGDGRPVVAEERTIKDAAEVKMLQAAADAAIAGHEAALATMRTGNNERHAEAAFLHAIRTAAAEGPGYPPIVGTGANAAVLHYIDNESNLASGELVLMDAGASWGHYNSDITRTVPVDGEWSNDQRELYAIVLEAQDAAMAAVKPGNRFRDPHDAACRVLADGLADRGWIADANDDEALRRFYMHGTSHYLGLDVHDPGRYRDGDDSRVLEPGMVLTVEPGLYANPHFTNLPDGVAPFGIRIENDLVVTEDGHHDLTAGLTRDMDALAALVRQ